MLKEKRIYTVSELTQDIKLILETTFPEIFVEGEVSNLHKSTSGHIYFTLKDERSQLKTVLFRGSLKEGLKFELKDGLQIICFGRVSVYDRDGQYQLYIQRIEPKGLGALQLAFQQLKERLAKEGLFDEAHKIPIPYLPQRIGIVTSPTGAVIRDILNILNRRFPDVEIIIYSVAVQGKEAAPQIAQAVRDLNKISGIDVLVLARGGGSLEDLWPFNEEIVARAIYESKLPVISAVGHETDWTIADFVADLRAPTPSAAAELLLPKKEDIILSCKNLNNRLKNSLKDLILQYEQSIDDLIYKMGLILNHSLEIKTANLKTLFMHLRSLSPEARILEHQQRLKHLNQQLMLKIKHSLELKHSYFQSIVEKLGALSPLNILSRGYSITFKMPEALVIKDAKLVRAGDRIKTRLAQGELVSRVEKTD